MALTATSSASAVSARSRLVLDRLRYHLTESLRNVLPQPDARVRGIITDEIISTVSAVFELQRVELHSDETDVQRLDITLVASAIELLARSAYFPDIRSPTLPVEMEPILRLLAAALRLYKYNGRSLEHRLHTEVYQSIARLSKQFKDYRSERKAEVKVDDWNVDFLLLHCQYLLASIDSSETVTNKVGRRVIIALDAAIAGVGGAYHSVRPALMEILKRKRSRPRWHEEYTDLEDACWIVLASEVQARSAGDRDLDIQAVLEEAKTVTCLLQDIIDLHLGKGQRLGGPLRKVVGKAIGMATELLQESGPYEQHPEYLPYGVLDLIYQLCFRIRNRSRPECFCKFLKVIRMVLERSPQSADLLHAKATDIWNYICDLGRRDREEYGDDEDREAITNWIRQHPDNVERPENSKARFKRISSQLRKLRKKEKELFQQANDDARRVAANVTSPESNASPATYHEQHFFFNPQNRLALLQHLSESEMTAQEIELLAQLVQQPQIRHRLTSAPDPIVESPVEDPDLNVAPYLSMEPELEIPNGERQSSQGDLEGDAESTSAAVISGVPESRVDVSRADSDSESSDDIDNHNGAFSNVVRREHRRSTIPPGQLDNGILSPTAQSVKSSFTSVNGLSPPFSPRSDDLSGASSPRIHQRRTRQREPSYEFTEHKVFALDRIGDDGRNRRRADLIATCVSASGEFVALVGKDDFWVYKVTNPQSDLLKPKCRGKFEVDGQFKHGFHSYPLQTQGRIMSDGKKREFKCAAINDEFLVIGASVSGCILFFSITEAGQGKYCFKLEHTHRIIRQLFFDSDSKQLAMLFTLSESQRDICHVYSVNKTHLTSAQQRRSEGAELPLSIPDCDLELNTSYQTHSSPRVTYKYTPRDAKFSSDGSKIVIITTHAEGTALVFILVKDDQNIWHRYRERIKTNDLDARDVNCLGYTGVSLYPSCFTQLISSCRRKSITEDAIIFSLDFPVDRLRDSYRVDYEAESLLKEKKRICGKEQNPGLAISVSSHGICDLAVLGRDGRVWLQQGDYDSRVLGRSRNVNAAEQSAMDDVISLVTLAFSKDGQKLLFIDNRGELHIFGGSGLRNEVRALLR